VVVVVVVMPVATMVQLLGKKPQPLWPTTNNRHKQAAVHQSLMPLPTKLEK